MYEIYTDGSVTLNPNGAMGYGVAVYFNGKPLHTFAGYDPEADDNTNNKAEHLAMNYALDWIKDNVPQKSTVKMYSDSNLVVNQVNGTWRIKNGSSREIAEINRILFFELKQNYGISLSWVSRNNNTITDILSHQATKENPMQIWNCVATK